MRQYRDLRVQTSFHSSHNVRFLSLLGPPMQDFLGKTGARALKATVLTIGYAFVAVFAWIVYVLSIRFVRTSLPYYGEPLSFGWAAHLLAGVWLLTNVCGYYILCVFTGPGLAPKGDPASRAAAHDQYLKDSHQFKRTPYCRQCGIIPPPRASHCYFCDGCVLEMDHHCPWVLGCVGYNNHHYFIVYLVYCVIGTAYVAAVSTPMMADMAYLESVRPFHQDDVRASLVISTVTGSLLLLFGGFHVYLAMTNQTSLDSFEAKLCSSTSAAQVKLRSYNKGVNENLRNLFGTSWGSGCWRLLIPCRIVRPPHPICSPCDPEGEPGVNSHLLAI